MTDRMNEPTNQPQIDSRANLFHFLQTLSGLTEDRGLRRGSETLLSDEQIETCQRPNGTVL